jgi:alpha-tubulin suppressor-like RCC1 family protein
MRRWLVVLVACGGSADHRKEVPRGPMTEEEQVAAQERLRRYEERVALARQRNAALSSAPFDYKPTDKPCPVALPRDPMSRDITWIAVAEIDRASVTADPLDERDPRSGVDTIVISEARSAAQEIGRLYVWDRKTAKMICGAAYQLPRADLKAKLLATAKPLALVETASIVPEVPDHLPARTGKRVVKVAIGDSHFCAVVEDGTVRCFGQNDMGQCGDMKGPDIVAKPFKVPGITDAIDIAAGGKHACVRRRSGAITCWGDNYFGEVGPSAKTNRVLVTRSMGGVRTLVAGHDHTCVLDDGGAVTCWGDSSSARGVWKTKIEDQREPQPHRIAVARAAELCTTSSATCVRLASGGVRCWGTRYGDKPVAIAGAEAATALLCNGDAAEVCWTNGDRVPHCSDENRPVVLPPTLRDVAWLGFGWDHACALHADETASCWGKNEWGQLGNGKQEVERGPVPTRPLGGEPTRVRPLVHVKQLAVGNERTAAILDDGALATWGYGPIGDGRDCSGPPCDGLVPTVIPLD